MQLTRRAVVAGLLASPATAWAQDWPTRQLMVQPGLQQAPGVTVIVENVGY